MIDHVIEPPPEEAHDCELGGAATVPLGTIAHCSVCGRWSYTVVVLDGIGRRWSPVTRLPWHRPLRRRIRRYLAERDGSAT